MIISFSGLDGSGKSTLISEVEKQLISNGKEVIILTMYDHVGTYAIIRFIRDSIFKKIFKKISRNKRVPQHQTTNDPDRLGLPQAKRGLVMSLIYQLVRSSHTRKVTIFFDLFLFIFYRLYIEGFKKKVLIMDRYFYDWMADVADGEDWSYVKFF